MTASPFQPDQLATLRAILEVVNPKLEVERSDSVSVFAHSLNHDRMLAALERQWRELSNKEQTRLGRWLRALSRPWQGFHWKTAWSRFSRLSPTQRTATIQRILENSPAELSGLVRGILRQANYFSYAVPSNPETIANPTWEALNYHPSRSIDWETDEILEASPIRPNQRTFAADYLIVGSGAGGAVTAAELAETGKSVLIVDAGPLPTPGQMGQSEFFANRHWTEIQGGLPTRQLPVTITSGRIMGGGTVLNWGTCLDPPPDLLQFWAQQFGFRDCLAEGYRHSLYSVRRRLDVSRPERHNRNNEILFLGCQKLGWKTRDCERNGGNCRDCSTCGFGCTGGKRDALRTYLLDAVRLGAHLLPNCQVLRLEIGEGRAQRAIGTLREPGQAPREIELRFRQVILAAGAIETPALLLRSGLKSPHLGKHLQLQPAAIVLGKFSDPVRAWMGPPQSVVCEEFLRNATGAPFRLESVPLHPGFLAMVLPWHDSAQHKRLMQSAESLAGVLVLMEDREEKAGSVQLGFGNRTQVSYRCTPRLRAGLGQGIASAAQVLRAAGAEEMYLPVSALSRFHNGHSDEIFERFSRQLKRRVHQGSWVDLFSAHPLSSCRLASSPSRGAIDSCGRVFQLRNVFVTDGSALPTATGVNPQLTILTTAHFLSQGIKRLTA